jgi:hypothetical protein
MQHASKDLADFFVRDGAEMGKDIQGEVSGWSGGASMGYRRLSVLFPTQGGEAAQYSNHCHLDHDVLILLSASSKEKRCASALAALLHKIQSTISMLRSEKSVRARISSLRS